MTAEQLLVWLSVGLSIVFVGALILLAAHHLWKCYHPKPLPPPQKKGPTQRHMELHQ